jgi:hypothetical protein
MTIGDGRMNGPGRRRARALATLLATTAACLASVAPAQAAVPAEPAVPAEAVLVDTVRFSGLISDGERYVAYGMPDGTLKVIDEQEDRSFQVPLPAGCRPVRGGTVIGGGQLGTTCTTPDEPNPRRPAIVKRLDLATRAWSDVPGSERWLSGSYGIVELRGIGDRRIAYQRSVQEMVWVDWRTGAASEDHGAATDAPALDGEGLFAPMCASLQRPVPFDRFSRLTFMPTAYEAPHAVSLHPQWVLTAQGCDEPRATALGGSVIEMANTGGGLVTWRDVDLEGDDTFAYLLSCRQRLGWLMSPPATIAHVRGALYVMDATEDGAAVRRLPLPESCLPTPRVTVTGAGRGQTLSASRWIGPTTSGAPEVRRLEPLGAVAPRVAAARRTLAVRTPRRAAHVAWRVAGDERWRPARRTVGDGRSWRVVAPSGRGDVRLELQVGGQDGATVDYAVRVSRRP